MQGGCPISDLKLHIAPPVERFRPQMYFNDYTFKKSNCNILFQFAFKRYRRWLRLRFLDPDEAGLLYASIACSLPPWYHLECKMELVASKPVTCPLTGCKIEPKCYMYFMFHHGLFLSVSVWKLQPQKEIAV
jgi:hypothetical protein